MTSASAVAHLADSFQGLADAQATVKYLIPKSKESALNVSQARTLTRNLAYDANADFKFCFFSRR